MNRFGWIFMFFLLLASTVASAEDTSDFKDTALTGDWGGLRTRLYGNGYDFGFYETFDVWSNLSGGVKQGQRGLSEFDFQLMIDGDKAFGLTGTKFFALASATAGGRINQIVGSNGGIDSIETLAPTLNLSELWGQKEFFDGRLSILAGLHDLNAEFYVTDTSALFLNPTYGIGTEMGATGRNGPSVFPNTGLALRVAVHPTTKTYLQAGLFDGVPGKVGDGRGTHISLRDKDAALQVVEGGIKDEKIGHFAIGGWRYTSKLPDTLNPTARRTSEGLYVLADRSIFQKGDKDISAFARFGMTRGDVERFENSWSIGVVGSGWVPKRPEAKIGFAVSQNTNASKYLTASGPLDRHETQLELTYRDQITPSISIQPSLQYTINPGTDPAAKNALTIGLRFGINF